MRDVVRRWSSALALAAVAAAACAAFAQAPAAPPAAPVVAAAAAPEGVGLPLWEVIRTGGRLMYVLGAMSVAALALVIYFAVVLRQEAVLPAGFLRDLRDALLAGRDEEARALCRRDRSAIAAVAAAGLAYLRREAAPDPALLREVLESEGSRQAVEIQNRTQYLLDLAVIAPMVGLLGTVVGMLRAFNAVALDLARARPMVLAGGVSQALITTVGGLVVAIPAMACYAYFRNRGTRLVALLETGAAELLTLLLAKKAP